jgi:hypothetical protein
MKKRNLLFTAIAIIGFATATMAQLPSYVPTNGLFGYWPFTGNANDVSGNGNNGIVNGATLSTDRFGNINNAYSFNGTNNYISVFNTPFTNVPFTISAWVKLNSLVNSQIIGLGETGTTNHKLYFTSSYSVNTGKPGIGISGACDITSTSNTVTNNVWTYLVVCVSSYSVSGVTFYINGIAYTNNTTAGALFPFPLNNTGFTIGKHTATNSEFLNGIIDEVGIWNRVLTQQEITALYQGCNGILVSTQPNNQNVSLGNNAQFIITITNSTATYQWQTDLGFGFQNLSNATQYNGATNDTLIVSNTQLSNNNQQFRCIVNDGGCKDTSTVATLTIANIGINETNQNQFKVYPNPASSQINVQINQSLIGSTFAITDQIGKTVLSGKLNAEKSTIELEDLSGGIYLFSIGNNAKQTFKVIKK